jgi:hypothetical protein
MAGPRGFIATSLVLIGMEVVLTSDAGAFANLNQLLGVPGALAEAYLSPSVPTFRSYAERAGAAAGAAAAAAGAAGTGTAQLTPDFRTVPLPASVPAPQVAGDPGRARPGGL